MLLNDVWIYDHQQIRGNVLKLDKVIMPLPREGIPGISKDGRTTMFGGISYGIKPFNDVWEYSISMRRRMGMAYKKMMLCHQAVGCKSCNAESRCRWNLQLLCLFMVDV